MHLYLNGQRLKEGMRRRLRLNLCSIIPPPYRVLPLKLSHIGIHNGKGHLLYLEIFELEPAIFSSKTIFDS